MEEKYMNYALIEAKKALDDGEMPVGAVIVLNNKIIGYGYNRKEKNKNSLSHAEIIAINDACKKINDWRLNNCEIYITMEPCLMCMGAIIESRIKKVYCGITNNKFHNLNQVIINENKIDIEYDIMSQLSLDLLEEFFKNIRNRE